MKQTTLILFLTFSISCQAQIESFFPKEINSKNENENYNRLLKIYKLRDIDSANAALKITYNLCEYNPVKYNSVCLQPIISALDSFRLDYFTKILVAKWVSEGLGSNWGGKIFNPNTKLIITKQTMVLYRSDTTIMNSRYFISSDTMHHKGLVYKNYFLNITDLGEKWQFNLITVGHSVPYHKDADRLYLLFNKKLTCVCGCPDELYSIDKLDNFE